MKLQHIALACLCTLLAAGVYLTIKSDMDAQLEEQKAYNKQLIEKMSSIEKRIEDQPAAAAPAAPAAAPAVAAVPSVVPTVTDVPEAPNPPAAPRKEINPDSPPGATVRSGTAINSADPGAAPPELTTGEMEERERDILNNSTPEAERTALETAGVPEAAPSGRRLTKTQQLVLAQPAIARISENKEDTGFVIIDRGTRAKLVKGDAFAVRRGTAIIGRVAIGDTIEDDMAVADIKSVVTGMQLEVGDEIIKFDQQ
jgi:hypothetical protein